MIETQFTGLYLDWIAFLCDSTFFVYIHCIHDTDTPLLQQRKYTIRVRIQRFFDIVRMSSLFFILLVIGNLIVRQSNATVVTTTTKCYPPLEVYVVDLDLAPEDRWTALAKKKKTELLALLDALDVLIGGSVADDLVNATNATMSDEYRKEISGIANAIDAKFNRVLMANIYYEISGVGDTSLDLSRSCTSIVAQRSNGTVYLARNQDYPPPFELVQVHLQFERNGTLLFQGTGFAGTIGLATGTRTSTSPQGNEEGWAVSINARGNPAKGTSNGVQAAIESARRGASIFPLITREAFQVARTYKEAMKYLSSKDLIMEGYIIVGGSSPGEGAIVTRNASGAETNLLSLFDPAGSDEGGGDWYVCQTNTDHFDVAPSTPDSTW